MTTMTKKVVQNLINRGYRGIAQEALKTWKRGDSIRARDCTRCRGSGLTYRKIYDGSKVCDLCPSCNGKGRKISKKAA